MQRPKPGKAGLAPKIAGQVQLTDGPREHGGLVLDDFLATLDAFRRAYKLPEAKFRLQDIERQAAARPAVERLITSTLARHAPNIYAKPHPLLNKIYDIRRGRRIEMPSFYSGWKIQPTQASQILRALLERALQTIIQLPKKDPPLTDGTRELRLLALHCDRLAQEIEDTGRTDVIRKRASLYFGKTKGPGLNRILRQVGELRKTAEKIRAILAKTRKVKQKTDSPNPQVRIALYLIGWFQASTGEKQYASIRTLLNAAYATNNIEAPSWMDRLEIEMTRRRARRKAWAKSITV